MRSKTRRNSSLRKKNLKFSKRNPKVSLNNKKGRKSKVRKNKSKRRSLRGGNDITLEGYVPNPSLSINPQNNQDKGSVKSNEMTEEQKKKKLKEAIVVKKSEERLKTIKITPDGTNKKPNNLLEFFTYKTRLSKEDTQKKLYFKMIRDLTGATLPTEEQIYYIQSGHHISNIGFSYKPIMRTALLPEDSQLKALVKSASASAEEIAKKRTWGIDVLLEAQAAAAKSEGKSKVEDFLWEVLLKNALLKEAIDYLNHAAKSEGAEKSDDAAKSEGAAKDFLSEAKRLLQQGGDSARVKILNLRDDDTHCLESVLVIDKDKDYSIGKKREKTNIEKFVDALNKISPDIIPKLKGFKLYDPLTHTETNLYKELVFIINTTVKHLVEIIKIASDITNPDLSKEKRMYYLYQRKINLEDPDPVPFVIKNNSPFPLSQDSLDFTIDKWTKKHESIPEIGSVRFEIGIMSQVTNPK